jgi:hypothetical protein
MFELLTVLLRAKHLCSFFPHTPRFHPHSTTLYPEPLHYTDSANEAWATLSSSSYSPYWYRVMALFRLVASSQSIFILFTFTHFVSLLPCHIPNFSWTASLTPLAPLFVTGWWLARSSYDLQLHPFLGPMLVHRLWPFPHLLAHRSLRPSATCTNNLFFFPPMGLFFLDSLTLKMTALWSFEMPGITRLMTQCMLEDLDLSNTALRT